ncbi:MAG: cupin domain-containing protein [Oligoflexales bacterium]|nr:cupin domain-containing protein [Oligoflexales bacterium]
MEIVVEQNISDEKIASLGIRDWPVWSKEVSKFPWHYDERESCYLISGEVVVTPDGGGKPVTIRQGDYAVFPAGLSCTWDIKKPLKKYYNFD